MQLNLYHHFVLLFMILFIATSGIVSGEGPGGSGDGTGEDSSGADTSGDTGGEGGDTAQPDENPQQEEAQEAVDTQTDYSGETPPDTDVTLSSGETVSVSGQLDIVAGEITYSEYLTYNDARFEGAYDFHATLGSYTAGAVDRLSHGGSTITSGTGIYFNNGILTAIGASSFLGPGSLASNVADLSSEISFPFKVYLSYAEQVQAGGIHFKDVEDSTFDIYGNGVKVTSGKGSAYKISDNAGNEVEYEAITGSSNISIFTSTPPKYVIQSGILSHQYEIY